MLLLVLDYGGNCVLPMSSVIQLEILDNRDCLCQQALQIHGRESKSVWQPVNTQWKCIEQAQYYHGRIDDIDAIG